MTTADEPDLTSAPGTAPESPPVEVLAEPALTEPKLTATQLAELLMGAATLPTEGTLAALPSGELDITMGQPHGVVHLPRPLFGQMKVLIRAETRLANTLKTIEQRNAAYRNKAMEDLRAFQGDAGEGNVALSVENLEGLAAVRDETLAIAEQGEEETDAALTEFWQLVFSTVLDTTYDPDKWPADLLDASVPKKAIAHWRYAQPGPG